MAMQQNAVVVGVFEQPMQAKNAVEDLRRAGYREDEIGFLARAGASETGSEKVASTTTGVVSGGVIGGVLGAAGALLIPGIGPAIAGGILAATLGAAGVGALVGGIVGTLTGMGLSEQQARYYQRELEEGRTIVLVKSVAGQEQTLDIMRRNGAINADTEIADYNRGRPPVRVDDDTTPSTKKDEPGGKPIGGSHVLPPDAPIDNEA